MSFVTIEVDKPHDDNPWLILRRFSDDNKCLAAMKLDKKGIHPLAGVSRRSAPLPWSNVLRQCYLDEDKSISPERAKREASVGTISIDLGSMLAHKRQPIVYLAIRGSKKIGQQSMGEVILTLGVTDSGIRMALSDHDVDKRLSRTWNIFLGVVRTKIKQVHRGRAKKENLSRGNVRVK